MKPNLRKSEVRRLIRLDQLGGFVNVEVRGETPVFRRLQKRRLVDRLGIYGWQLSNLGRAVLEAFRTAGRGEDWVRKVYVHRCPHCREPLDEVLTCSPPKCAFCRRSLAGSSYEDAQVAEAVAHIQAVEERRAEEEKKRAQAFEEYEERLRRSR